MNGQAHQIPLSFTHDAARTRDDLAVCEPVRAAVGIVDRWPDWGSPVVVLAGPPGCGKSHLANIWRERSGATTVLPGESAARTGAEAASEGPVLIEDADRAGFANTALFHIINAVRQAGTSVLMTARARPAAWAVTLPDLASRLAAATVVEIGEPDEPLLAQVIFKLFADRQIEIDDKVVHYLVMRMERSLFAAQDLVARMDEIALSRSVRITRAVAAEALAQAEHAG
ncbi:DnaA regulatory inactivator HdaA [Pararhizobium mangrovi]|uniref:Uncharacterized protein n=1 Tax=Pararhizobium mangrovi TaxID=2590452 RepID=A0A506UH28_9HYPH|nr:DnaA regulatory inactivator HdaA [Pararhizobium mangrovi]TPW32067.1 hypothetical protein FJU11_02465 [Pararhizobium mangrovi]